MRSSPAALALLLLACAPSDRGDAGPRDSSATPTPGGLESLVLRVPRAGGPATAYRYADLDSAVWRSGAALPAMGRILAFDADGGSLAYVDGAGAPGRLDLRLGTVARAGGATLRAIQSADGSAIFGVDSAGAVVRLTPAGGPWRLTPPAPARQALPQPDGWLVVVADRGDETMLFRLHPPEERIVDSLSLPRTSRAVPTRVGDRLYLAAEERLLGVRSQGLEPVPGADFDAPVTALATTPSGDRVFVATADAQDVAIVDRYEEGVTGEIRLPGAVRDLRMDPLGRLLLVRPAAGDSVWVVAVSSGQVLGAAASAWRDDLPFVATDGAVAVLRGDDVVFLTGEGLAPGRRVAGGAADLWYPFVWSGFRPRAESLDDEVRFRERAPRPAPAPADSDTVAVDTTGAATQPPPVVQRPQPPAPAGAPGAPAAPRATRPARPSGFYVSFAALLNADRARELAAQITVDGQAARVYEGQQGGTTIHRVLLGPYGSRDDAERVGQASGRTFFIFEGAP